MLLNNNKIHSFARELYKMNISDIKMPVRVGFFLQKNIRIITDAATEIEQAKMSIAAQYGKLNEAQTGYDIPPENVEVVNQELNDLFNLEQDLPIHIFKLSDFDGIELTYQQMSAIMFMIEE